MPPRRSQRIAVAGSTSQPTRRSVNPEPVPVAAPVTKPAAKRRRIAIPKEDDDDDDSGDDSYGETPDDHEDEARPTPKRKQKRAKGETSGSAGQDAPSQWKHVRGKRGILEKITDTPLDVLFEIFSYLEPLDLLRISRTTKDLRQLLMSKSSAFIWERARLATEGLPPIPDDLNDPQYINLLFDKHCHECGNGFTQSVQWEARLRLCKNCLQSNSIMTANIEHLAQLSTRYSDLAAITPKYILVTSSGRYSSKRTTYYHLATYQRLAAESVKASDFRAWIAPKYGESMALSTSCKPYERCWLALRDQRLSSILERLKADGWTEELKDASTLDTVRSHKLVNQAKVLTDRIWDNIEPTLTALMTIVRDELLAKKIRTAVPRRIRLVIDLCKPILSTMPEIPVIPDPSFIPNLQPFRDIIKNTPYNQDLNDDDLAEALTTLPDICTSWRQQQEDDLTSKLCALGRDVDLSLVVNAFTCANCSCDSNPVLHYPYFASHACFTVTSYLDAATSWDCTRIKAVDRYRTNCEEIIAYDMDATDAFFRCEACQSSQWQCPGYKVSYLMRWRTAMNHMHLGKLQRVTDSDFITRAKTEEQSTFKTQITSPWSRGRGFVCNHCGAVDTSPYPETRMTHLRTIHGVTDGIENHYSRSVKDALLSDSYRIAVPDGIPTPADTVITTSTADGTLDALGPTTTDASDTTSVGDAVVATVGEGEAGNPAPHSSSIAPLDSGTEEHDAAASGDTVNSPSADSE
ncbi:hypothetical protein BDZ89DRAFT_1082273 [Hymenopellis radicata]|nr:hypothetical protein BDZ89DRAFT_1082273 [Hymenopellis radicata]